MWHKYLTAPHLWPRGRSSHTLVCSSFKKLLILGGEDTPRHPFDDLIHQFDFSTSLWSSLPTTGTKPGPILAHSLSVVDDNSLYLYGGRNENHNDLDDLFKLDLNTLMWSRIDDAQGQSPGPRSYHASASIGSDLFIFGGCCSSGRSNELFKYDTEANCWHKLPSSDLLKPRGGPALAVTNTSGKQGKLYVHGGYNGTELDDLWVFDSHLLSWSCLSTSSAPNSEVPSARSVHCLVNLKRDGKDYLFMFGGEKQPSSKGHEGAGLYHDDAFLLDLETNEWKKVCSGADNNGNNEDNEQGSWSKQAPSARGWIAACSLRWDSSSSDPSAVALFGGFDGNARLNDLFVWK